MHLVANAGTNTTFQKIDNKSFESLRPSGKATPVRIAELEEIFELNRNSTKIR